LGEEVQHMIHRLPRDKPARAPDGDGDVLRTVASAANDAVDAVSLLPAARIAHGLSLVAQRYGRALEVSARDLQEALQAARVALRTGKRVAVAPKTDNDEASAAATQPQERH
jgi:eukaryotic-like serine/threonine-protein kinase